MGKKIVKFNELNSMYLSISEIIVSSSFYSCKYIKIKQIIMSKYMELLFNKKSTSLKVLLWGEQDSNLRRCNQ
ncbi:MAG: hypothetical protein ACOVMG_07830, partial [Flavobacterium sp.]